MSPKLCAIAAIAACTPLASAQLYGSDSAGNYYLVDETTGAATVVVADGSTYNFHPQGATEIEINPATGIGFAQNPAGAFSGNQFDALTGASLGASVATTDVHHGLEYVGDTLYSTAFQGISAMLYILDPVTGQDTVVGDTGFRNPLNGLAYDVTTDTMYVSAGRNQELYTIDLNDASLTLIGSLGVTVGSIEFGSDGRLYAGGGQANAGNIYTVDLNTGAATFLGETGLGNTVTGLTLLPAPSSLALLSLAGLTATRRRR